MARTFMRSRMIIFFIIFTRFALISFITESASDANTIVISRK